MISPKKFKKFRRNRLPLAKDYYSQQFQYRKSVNTSNWITVLCCFHEDHHPSLSLNLETGAFKCFACGECGKDIVDFYQRYHHVDFKAAAKALGAWRD